MLVKKMIPPVKQTFIFLRHGEPVGGKIFRGSSDDPLTEKGWQQMHKAVDSLSFDEIISSPLKRCAEFANKLANKSNRNLTINKKLKEMHLGDWEGWTVEQVAKQYPEALTAFWKQPHRNPPPNAERFTDFERRILTQWNSMQQTSTECLEEKTILVIAHAGVMMVLLKKLLNIPMENIYSIKLNYASKLRIETFGQSNSLKPQIYVEHGYEF